MFKYKNLSELLPKGEYNFSDICIKYIFEIVKKCFVFSVLTHDMGFNSIILHKMIITNQQYLTV